MFRSPLMDALVVVIILLLFFGPKRLPMLSRSIGESIKEFKGGIKENGSTAQKSELSAAPSAPSESAEKVSQRSA